MEPTIKSEPCETIFTEEQSVGQECNASNLQPYQGHFQRKAKRSYKEMDQSISGLDVKPLRKQKRLVEGVLFNAPFFNLTSDSLPSNRLDAISAYCCSCERVVRGNRGVSSNFLKHLKSMHPEINKLFEEFKAHKIEPEEFPAITQQIVARRTLGEVSAQEVDITRVSGSDSNATYSNDDTTQFLDVSKLLVTPHANDSSSDKDSSGGIEIDFNNPITHQDTINDNQQLHVPNHTVTRLLELSAKTLETFQNMIDERIKDYVKHKEYDQLKEKVQSLTKRNTSNEPDLQEIKTELVALKKECAQLRLSLQQSQASKRQLQNELQSVDKLLHQRKLVIRNLKVTDPESPLKSVEKLLHETLHLPDIKILNCCIITSAKLGLDSNRLCLSVEVDSPQSCIAVFRQLHKLKNTGIFIESEISTFQRKRKDKLMVLRKELLRRNPELKVLVRDTTLVVNGKHFYWDDVEGLCHDCKYDAIDLNGVEYLNKVSGLDLREFINVLQNYNIQLR